MEESFSDTLQIDLGKDSLKFYRKLQVQNHNEKEIRMYQRFHHKENISQDLSKVQS